jgi:putative FmdB family regulatory protein
MPLYEFFCPQCQKKFEELCRTSRESVPCPQCAAESKKVLSAFRSRRSGSGEGGLASGGCGG